MLSFFPELLFLAPFSAMFIRIAAAVVFALIASKHLGAPDTTLRTIGVVEGIVALMLILGAYTQVSALGALALSSFYIFSPRMRALPSSTLWLLAVLALSLLLTGPGPIAFDLPL